MGFVKQLLLFGTYFLLLSTTLQSQDAFVFFFESQYQDEYNESPSRGGRLFIYMVFALLCYLTLLVTPYLNLTLRKLSLGACAILLAKYICELSTYAHVISNIMQLAAMVLDVVGQSLFYLTSIRVIQVICEKHDASEQAGRLFAVFGGIYALSIVIGYGISYGCYGMLPVWTYLIVLTCMTIISGVLCFFTFPLESRVAAPNQLHEQNQEANAGQAAPVNRQQAADQIYRDGMTFNHVFKTVLLWYQKMLLIICVMMTLGVFLGYSSNLLEYLVWTAQNLDLPSKLIHNVDVILIFGGGAIIASIVTGILCDCVSIRKVGYLAVTVSVVVFCLLYIGISVKSLSTTLWLYLLVGFSIFMMGVWLLCACSKIYSGKFQSFSVTIQYIGLAMSLYQVGVIMFEGRVDIQLRLCMELAMLIVSAIICFLFLRKLPSGQIEVMFEESQIEQTQSTDRKQPIQAAQVQVQMVNQDILSAKVQGQLDKKQPQIVDADYLL